MDANGRPHPTVNRELSWLDFNARVLEEAMDPSVPLFERLKFLAIFSSNLDEFFRVRVASLRSLLRLRKKDMKHLSVSPGRLLREIHREVHAQQERFGEIFRERVLPDMRKHGVGLVDESGVTSAQANVLRSFFQSDVRPLLNPVLLDRGEAPFLKDRGIYLVVELWPTRSSALSAETPRFGIVEVPSPPLDRFVSLPAEGEGRGVMFLDDVVRLNLPSLFPDFDVGGAYAIKLSRDSELYLEDEFSGDIVEAIKKSLPKRARGLPCRFLYDMRTPYALVSYLRKIFGLEDEDLVMGGRYHNLHDLGSFPRDERRGLVYPKWDPLVHPELEHAPSLIAATAERDRVLHFPYQSYEYVIRFLTEAARDPDVEELYLTVYRVSRESPVLSALLEAAERGKKVRVFMEVQARFDEEANLAWAERMEAAGVVTMYSLPGIKVHAKLALVVRREGGERRLYSYVGTGNFNERTARQYTDIGLLTADPRITTDVELVFDHLGGKVEVPSFRHLLVAPFNLREGIVRLIEREARAAANGRPSGIRLKLNALEDEEMIEELYRASRAGVPIDLVVRGICCLVPGQEGHSETIRVRSIVDRYLEHSRIWVFHNGGDEEIFIASADWMTRNLSHRVEVAVPLYDPEVRRQVGSMLDFQLADDAKARVVGSPRSGSSARGGVRAQEASRRFVEALAENGR
jgi:polyphosphate kinase